MRYCKLIFLLLYFRCFHFIVAISDWKNPSVIQRTVYIAFHCLVVVVFMCTSIVSCCFSFAPRTSKCCTTDNTLVQYVHHQRPCCVVTLEFINVHVHVNCCTILIVLWCNLSTSPYVYMYLSLPVTHRHSSVKMVERPVTAFAKLFA